MVTLVAEKRKKRISMRLTSEKPIQRPSIPPRFAINVFRVII